MANLADIIPAFMIGPNGQRLTPEQIRERQQIAESLMAQATDTSPNAGGVASILAKGVQGFAAGRARNQADAAAGNNAKASSANVASLLGLLGGGSAAPVSQGATVANPMVAPVQSVAPGVDMVEPPQKIDISGDKQTFIQSLLPAAIEESARTGVDPRIIVAQAAQETGWGKSAPGNNYFGIKSHGQSGGQTLATNEIIDGKTVRINDSFRQFASPADSVKGYGEFILQNPRYKPLREAQGIDAQLQALQASGYATDPNYSRSVGAIARSIPLPQSGGYSDPMVSTPQSAPMTTAQPASSGINPAIVEALSSPYASEQERSVAGLLLNQQMSQQQTAQKQAMEAQDPLRQLQLRKAELEVQGMQNPGSNENFYGNPVAVQNPDGSVAYGQIGNRGTFKPIQLGEGQSFAPPTRTIDAGTETLMVDQAGNVISRTPKNNRTAASETAAGGVEGRVTTERELSAPRDFQAAQNAIDILDQIEKHPGLDLGTGATSLGNRIPGTPGYDFQNLVEQAKSGAFLSAIEQLRGLGALSNAEGGAATAATNRMDTATTKEGFLAAVRDYRKIIQQGADRAKNNMKAPEDSAATSPTTTPKRRKFNPATGMLE